MQKHELFGTSNFKEQDMSYLEKTAALNITEQYYYKKLKKVEK